MTSYTFRAGSFEGDYTESHPGKSVIFGNHSHLTCEFMFITEGTVSLSFEDRVYRDLSAGAMVMIPPMTYHSSYSTVPCRYRRLTVRFPEEEIPEEIRRNVLSKMRDTPVISWKGAEYLTDSLYRVFTKKDTFAKRGSAEGLFPLVRAVMVQFFYYALEAEVSAGGTGPAERDERLVAAISYVDEHMDEIVTVPTLAKAAFVSESTLSHLFRSRMKISVKQYVLQKKIHYAAGLIGNGVPAQKAAEAVGYKNYADFYAVYKKATGKAPSEGKGKK